MLSAVYRQARINAFVDISKGSNPQAANALTSAMSETEGSEARLSALRDFFNSYMPGGWSLDNPGISLISVTNDKTYLAEDEYLLANTIGANFVFWLF